MIKAILYTLLLFVACSGSGNKLLKNSHAYCCTPACFYLKFIAQLLSVNTYTNRHFSINNMWSF